MTTVESIELGNVELFDGSIVKLYWADSEVGIVGVTSYEHFEAIRDHLMGAIQGAASGAPDVAIPEEASEVEPTEIEAAVEEESEQGVIDEEEQPDYSAVYARMTKLGDLVKFLQELGYADYASILDASKQIQASGECPMLLKVDNLEKRLKTTCTALQIPMVA